MADYSGVMIYGETADGALAPITKELLAAGRRLAEALGEELSLLFIGGPVGPGAAEAAAFGADRVILAEHEALAGHYRGDVYAAGVQQVVEKVAPRILLFGHTEAGADLGPRVSFRMNRPMTTDCVELSVEKETKRLMRTKPVHGGLALATYTTEGFPQFASLRPKSVPPAEKGPDSGEIVHVDVDLDGVACRTRVLERVTEEATGITLDDAEVIVSGGRGMGGADGFKELEKVARMLNGAVGGSRVAVDNNWIPSSMQIGLTGTIVAPKVYLAIAISGASQHMTGCSRSQRIIAINRDPQAPIFKQAHFGVVGDWKTVLPAFMEKLESLG